MPSRACCGGNRKYCDVEVVEEDGLPLAGFSLPVIKWLRKKGYSWGNYVYAVSAIPAGNEIVQYMKENGCPWNEETLRLQLPTAMLNS